MLQASIKSISYRKGDYIFRSDEPSDTLHIVNYGAVKIFTLSEAGKEHILRFLFPGDFAGQFAMFQQQRHYANAVALENTSICHIHRDDLKRILESNPEMTYRFMAALTERLREADEWAGAISMLDVESRLAKTLLLFRQKHALGDMLELPVTKRDFASLIGITPETLSRKLAVFETENIIELKGKKGIKLIDPSALEELSGAV
ncbi:Crp/Fnr family transcriptional regulator [Alicyclobacillus sp. SO9]|uniref:Crp/Fnr family transcriptional regulator n=1 Tax=Alicyclobacillus sp. SO9 TaxID=2665646 RepID=UPI001E60E9AC|nr:Crp/Fnr family transcriptional regulator [Alicyclobacillus sp. SO9]